MFSEIKPLKANLLRYNFIEYFNTQHFRTILIENDFDDTFYQYFSSKGRFDDEAKVSSFLELLNSLIKIWVDQVPNSPGSKRIQKLINDYIVATIGGYIDWIDKEKDLTNLFGALSKIDTVTPETVSHLKNMLEKKVFRNEDVVSETNILPEGVGFPSVKYAIITALEEDEMEKVLPLFVREEEIEKSRNFIEYGHFKNHPEKKIVYASQHNTGMVDAAVLATEIIVRFKPEYLIMTGVLGGKPKETNIGDVIIATRVFTIDKGKITDLGFRKEQSGSNINSKEIKRIQRNKGQIESFIKSKDETRNKDVRIHFGPIACVNQVIDIEVFFEKNISEVDRKAIALEMESFSVVRACELANDGKTTPIIIKSVMDNTQIKTDDAKTYASWTSARVLEFILEENLL